MNAIILRHCIHLEMAKAIPEGYHSITPYLVVNDAVAAIDYYKRAFDAKETYRHPGPDGKSIINAELRIGDSILLLSDEFPHGGCLSPKSIGGSAVTLHIYTEDVDKVFNQAVNAGATIVMPVMDMFWGDRYGQLKDPFGHIWSIATHNQDLSQEEIQKAGESVLREMMGSQSTQ
jgi:PhnB protein